MRHLILLFLLSLAVYFGWRYMPSRPRFFVGRFVKEHLPWVGFIFGLIVVALFASASTTIKFF